MTYLCGGGVVLGVGALIITLSVMNGFQTDLRDKILGAQAHVLLQDQFGRPLPDDAGILGRIRAETGRAGGAYLGEDQNGDQVEDWVAVNDPRVFQEGRNLRVGLGLKF